MDDMNILFIGGGKMMQAIAGGLITRGLPATSLYAVEPVSSTRAVADALGVHVAAESSAMIPLLGRIDVIILAVKPQSMRDALRPFENLLTTHLVVSIAAGIRTGELSTWLGYSRIVRAMPNTPALIQAGITGMYAPSSVDIAGRRSAEELLASVGKTAWFDDEAMLDAVTAVSGSGPAYVFYAIEALEQSAVKLGFTPVAARTFAIETFRGASLLAAQSEESPSQLRANVTSRHGTTEAAIVAFDLAGIKTNFIAGVEAAAKRAKALGDEFSLASKPQE